MENVSFSIHHLRKIILKRYTQKTQEPQKKTKRNPKHNRQKIEKNWYLGHTDSDFVDF